MKKVFFVFIFFILFATTVFAGGFDKADVPKNIVIISQSSASSSTILMVVDLNNNELVVLDFGPDGKLDNVNRTGIIVNIDLQLQYSKSQK